MAKARELAAKQRNKRLKHMVSHPGETMKGMVKGLDPNQVAKGVWKDVKEAANGKKGGFARWAAGVGAAGKLSGWLAAVAGVMYVGLLFVPGVNVLALAQTALIAGATAIFLSAAESELRIQAAGDAKSEKEFKHQVETSAEAQSNAIVGSVMLASGFVLRIIGKIRLPGRLQNVSNALKVASKAVADKSGLSKARAALLNALKRARSGLPEALARELAAHKKAAVLLAKLSPAQFLKRLARGDKPLRDLTGISPERARILQEAAKTPAGKAAVAELIQQYRRAIREAPGSALARVHRVVRALDEAIKDVEAASTPREFHAAVDKASKILGEKAAAGRILAEREAALKQRVREQLLEKPEPPAAKPSTTAPKDMSAELIAERSALKDPRAIEHFDHMFERMKDSARMERAIKAMKKGGPLEKRLVSDWQKASKAPKPATGPELSQVPELVVEGRAVLRDVQSTQATRPDVQGLTGLARRAKAELDLLDEIRSGHRTADAATIDGIRGNLDGVKAELNAAMTNKGVTGVNRKFSGGGKEAEIDVVADNGHTWIDSKSVEPFTTKSSDWLGKQGKQGLKAQAEKVVEVAKHNKIGGKPPKVVYEFPKGVTESVARELVQIGKKAGVLVEVRGVILRDAKLVVPPGRDPHNEKRNK